MFKLKSTLAACIALTMIGAIITYATRPAVSGDSDNKTALRQASTAPANPMSTTSAPARAETLLAQAEEAAPATQPAADGKKPNILFIMGDDVGWFNIGAYHRGIMSGKTPHLDKLASARHDVHRLLCRGELHGGPGELHHRRNPAPHRV